ncbi:MAG: type II toxin-antitoxin system HicB family antitoxin [Parvibaculaceae bacterium]
MRYYIAVVHKDEGSAFGAHFPDLPGCFSAADTLAEVVPKAAEALALYAEDMPLPEPRSLDALRKDKDVAAHLARGAMLVAVPHIENDARVERANITMEAGLLRAVDAAAKARKLTRSAFLAQAARREIER